MTAKKLYRIPIVLSLFLFTLCGKDAGGNGGEDPITVPSVLTITDQRVSNGNFHTEASSAVEYIEVKTNITDWNASVISDGSTWLKVDPVREPAVPATGVEVTQKLKITLEENRDTNQRSAIIKISGGDMERTFKIIQAAAGYILTFDTPVYAAAAGETLSVKVTANVKYTVTVGCDWIEDISEPSDDYIRLRIAENDAKDARSAGVEVAAVGITDLKKILVVEQQGGEPAINVDGEEEINAAWDDPYFVLNVTANVAYRVNFEYETAGQEWIWRTASRSMTTKEEKFVLNANLSTESRKVTIQFLSDDADVSPAIKREVRVMQGGYTLPSDNVFELASTAIYSLTYKKQSIGIDVRTGKSPNDIAVGGLNGWVTLAGEPQRNQDILTYNFAISENGWPIKRNQTITFSAGGKTLGVTVYQDAGTNTYTLVEYNSLTGSIAEGSAVRLNDFDLDTYALSQAGAWPQDWTFDLKKPTSNEFNRIVYYPVTGIGNYGIKAYELLVFSEEHNIWYSVTSGTISESLYVSEETMRNGCNINFPTVSNVRKLTLRVKSERSGGTAFGAAEMHLTYDYTQDIQPSPVINIETASPLTIASGAVSATVGVSATTPYKVTVTDGSGTPDWIVYNADSSTPGKLLLTVTPNSGTQRLAVVTLTSVNSGVSITKDIMVIQEASAPTLKLLSPDNGVINLAYSTSRQYFTADLSTNISGITYNNLPSWITFEDQSTPSAGVVRYRFSASVNTGAARSHTIRFAGGGLTLDLLVSQAAKPDPGTDPGDPGTDPGTDPEPQPTLSLVYPDPADIGFAALPDPDKFEVVLATNVKPENITLGTLPDWISASVPVPGNGTLTYTFTIGVNTGDERNALVTFSATSLPTISVMVRQAAPPKQNKQVLPFKAVYYDKSINSFDASETIDRDKNTYHSIAPSGIWGYEFRFASNTELISFIYYPRDSDNDHGAFSIIEVEVVCHQGGSSITPFIVEIPASVYATSAARRNGWRIDLPYKAERVSHLRIIPIEGYQSIYSIAEVEFFAPE